MELKGNIEIRVHMNPTESEEMVQEKIKKTIGEVFPGAEVDFVSSVVDDDLNLISRIMMAVDLALNSYSADNIDVVLNEETGCLYVTYHSENNSFPLSEDICHKSLVDLTDLESALNRVHVGHCW